METENGSKFSRENIKSLGYDINSYCTYCYMYEWSLHGRDSGAVCHMDNESLYVVVCGLYFLSYFIFVVHDRNLVWPKFIH